VSWYTYIMKWSTIKLINTSSPPTVTFLCVVRMIKIYSFSKFQIYNIIRRIVTLPYIRSQNLFIFKLTLPTLWPASPHFPHRPPAPGNHHVTLGMNVFFFHVYLFIWLCQVLVAALRIFTGSCRIFCCGARPLWLWLAGFSCPAGCYFPDQGSNLFPLHCKVNS